MYLFSFIFYCTTTFYYYLHSLNMHTHTERYAANIVANLKEKLNHSNFIFAPIVHTYINNKQIPFVPKYDNL